MEGPVPGGYVGSQTQVVVTAEHGFDNGIFRCGFPKIGAHSYYYPNKSGGTLTGSWGTRTSWVDGECAGNLHNHGLLY